MFGRPVPKEIIEKRGEPVRYWGARAIFHPDTKHPIDLLPDRQGCKCAEGLASKPLLDWLNTKGMKELQNMRAFNRLSSDSAEVVEFKDGEFTVQCCPKRQLRLSLHRRLAILAEELPVRAKDPRLHGEVEQRQVPDPRHRLQDQGQHQRPVARRRHRLFRRARLSGYRGRLFQGKIGRSSTRSKAATPSESCSSASI